MLLSSMTSFAVAIEPVAMPRLAAAALLLHLAAAASPWFARVTPLLAAAVTLIAMAGLALTLDRLPGPHCRLDSLSIDSRGCRVRLRGRGDFVSAEIGPGSRAYALLALIDVRVAGRRFGWLLPAGTLPPGQFRRLKARIRLSC